MTIVMFSIVAVLALGFALSASESDNRTIGASGSLGTAAACRLFERHTLTSVPLDASGKPAAWASNRLVKFSGRAAAYSADRARPGSTQDLLRAYATAATSKRWTSLDMWRSQGAYERLESRCEPFTTVGGVGDTRRIGALTITLASAVATAEPRTYRLTVSVRNRAAQPVPGVRVDLHCDGGLWPNGFGLTGFLVPTDETLPAHFDHRGVLVLYPQPVCGHPSVQFSTRSGLGRRTGRAHVWYVLDSLG
jgi:hypothetical protein